MTNINEDIYIVYSSIIREKHKILSEYTECSGNFSQIIIYIMNEVILKFENPPEIYRTYFFYGKYALFLLKYKKLYISIMFPNVKINNKEIIFSLLYCFFDKLKSLKGLDLETISKMREYSLNFTDIFKEQINKFNKDCTSFISYLKKSNEFTLYEPFDDKYLDPQIDLPILSNTQVHADKRDNEDTLEEGVSLRKSYNSITQDSFKDDILKQNKSEKLIQGNDNSNVIIENVEDDNIKLKEKDKRDDDNNNKCEILKWIIIIIFVLLVLAVIIYAIYGLFS